MGSLAISRRKKLWFGTEERMMWFLTPNRDANMSPTGWMDGGTLLNGGGFQLGSFGSHREYIFEWPSSSPIKYSQVMKSFSDGTYGRGLIYFVDPMIYDKNILPSMWADPSIGIGYEGSSLVYGQDPTALPTSDWETNNLPIKSAYYNLAGVATGWRGKEDAVFIPIPEGHTLLLGGMYSLTGTGGVYFREQTTTGALGVATLVPALANNSSSVSSIQVQSPNLAGVWLYIGKSSAGAGSVTLSALSARLIDTVSALNPSKLSLVTASPWVGGQGHSGCRFTAKPTYSATSGVNGGQAGFSASFKEVGSWVNG